MSRVIHIFRYIIAFLIVFSLYYIDTNNIYLTNIQDFSLYNKVYELPCSKKKGDNITRYDIINDLSDKTLVVHYRKGSNSGVEYSYYYLGGDGSLYGPSATRYRGRWAIPDCIFQCNVKFLLDLKDCKGCVEYISIGFDITNFYIGNKVSISCFKGDVLELGSKDIVFKDKSEMLEAFRKLGVR